MYHGSQIEYIVSLLYRQKTVTNTIYGIEINF